MLSVCPLNSCSPRALPSISVNLVQGAILPTSSGPFWERGAQLDKKTAIRSPLKAVRQKLGALEVLIYCSLLKYCLEDSITAIAAAQGFSFTPAADESSRRYRDTSA